MVKRDRCSLGQGTLATLAALAVLLWGCGTMQDVRIPDTLGAVAPPAVQDGLQVALTSSRTQLAHGEIVPFSLIVRNVSETPVLIDPDLPKGVYFRIKSGNGKCVIDYLESAATAPASRTPSGR